jgi:iron-sulfur cluster repair protein YtfE (RIC family)
VDLLHWTVNEMLVAAPQTLGVLNRFGIDTCCGGTPTLAEAARWVRLAPETLIAAHKPALRAAK